MMGVNVSASMLFRYDSNKHWFIKGSVVSVCLNLAGKMLILYC